MSGTIIYVGNFELPDKNAAAHRVVNNGKLFGCLGFNTVFLGTSRTEHFDGLAQRDYFKDFDVYEQAYPESVAGWVKSIFDIRNINSLVEDYTDTAAVILYNTQYATLLSVKNALRGTCVRVIYDCTEWNGFTEGNFIRRATKSLDSRLIEKRLASACDGIIAVSRTMYDSYSGKKETLLLPPLVDAGDAVWHQQPEKNDVFTFLYAGSPSDKDRLDVLIKAFVGLPEGSAELRIIGVTQTEYSGVGIPDGVRFAGRLPHKDTIKEILGCGAFVFLREKTRRNNAGFPTKFAEAYTCGVPVITTDVSDIYDYPDENITVLPDVSEESVRNAMIDALSGITENRCLRYSFDYNRKTEECRRFFDRIQLSV
ncbi:MAG: glycosyltransferase [Clostridia bacterium]|nr:glycosyltransferase [Clostridia bacterium]